MMNELKWNKFHLKAPACINWNIDRNVSVHCPQGLPKNIICDMLRKYGKFLRFDKRGHLHVYFIENYLIRA